jgi:hypothetical protein
LRCLKAHTYHKLASVGFFTEIANFPRDPTRGAGDPTVPTGDPSNRKMVAFMRVYTAAHRLITNFEITEEVRM